MRVFFFFFLRNLHPCRPCLSGVYAVMCVCVSAPSPGHRVFEGSRCMHVPIHLTERRGARHPSFCLRKIKTAHKHAVTVTCKHTKASSEVSCDHATYLHSRFKETVYKAVVGRDPARWSWAPQTGVRERHSPINK